MVARGILVDRVLLIIARFATPDADSWISLRPIGEIGSALFTTGLVTILLDRVVGKVNEQRKQEMLKSTLQVTRKPSGAVSIGASPKGMKPSNQIVEATNVLVDVG